MSIQLIKLKLDFQVLIAILDKFDLMCDITESVNCCPVSWNSHLPTTFVHWKTESLEKR